MNVGIRAERADTPEAMALVQALTEEMAPDYPPESTHGYSVEKLIARSVAFFVLRVDGEAVGCGGLESVPEGYGELKRMYVRPDLRGQGLASRLLGHLEDHARSMGLPLLRLETGHAQRSAIALYERQGFRRIGPFGPYEDDPNSIYLEKDISSPA